MKISVIHPSFGRPILGTQAIQRNIDRMSLKNDVEYIVVIENKDKLENVKEYANRLADLPVTVKVSFGMTAVSAANLGANCSTGDLIVGVADDLELPWYWDADLQSEADWARANMGAEFVLHVSDGFPARYQRDLITIPICSRAYMARWGYYIWHEYQSLYADNDWTERAFIADSVHEVDSTRLTFRHLHRSVPGGFADDATYHHTSGRTARDIGRAVFERRRAAGFGVADWVKRGDSGKEKA